MTIAGWERYAGQARMGDSAVVYELYVNPVRPALYEITRYRVTSTALGHRRPPAQPRGDGEGPLEPGHRRASPSAASSGSRRASWKKLWLGASGEWRRIEPSTAAYKSEMRTAIQVYNLHNEQQVY